MSDSPRQMIARVNLRLSGLLEEARSALRGDRIFGAENVRSIRLPVEEMADVVARSAKLRRMHPEISGELDLYQSQLGEMQSTLAQIRLMLLAQQASMQAGRAHLAAVANWINAFRQTR